jgi:hypothetical protein
MSRFLLSLVCIIFLGVASAAARDVALYCNTNAYGNVPLMAIPDDSHSPANYCFFGGLLWAQTSKAADLSIWCYDKNPSGFGLATTLISVPNPILQGGTLPQSVLNFLK